MKTFSLNIGVQFLRHQEFDTVRVRVPLLFKTLSLSHGRLSKGAVCLFHLQNRTGSGRCANILLVSDDTLCRCYMFQDMQSFSFLPVVVKVETTCVKMEDAEGLHFFLSTNQEKSAIF